MICGEKKVFNFPVLRRYANAVALRCLLPRTVDALIDLLILWCQEVAFCQNAHIGTGDTGALLHCS